MCPPGTRRRRPLVWGWRPRVRWAASRTACWSWAPVRSRKSKAESESERSSQVIPLLLKPPKLCRRRECSQTLGEFHCCYSFFFFLKHYLNGWKERRWWLSCLSILRVLCLKNMSCLCFRWETVPPDGGSEGGAKEAESTAPVRCPNEITALESRKEHRPVNAWKMRDAFPSQLFYSLYINQPNKKSISCVLHRKEFKMLSQRISHIPTVESYKSFTRAGKQDWLGSLLRWKISTYLWSNVG